MKLSTKRLMAVIFFTAVLTAAPAAFAKPAKGLKAAEAAMMKACKKDYAEAVKGKSAHDVAESVETEEKGANADTFKKSDCYEAHEKWEGAAGKNEEGEAEHKS